MTIDFTSALYLGLEHQAACLVGLEPLTSGHPAALRSPPGSRNLARTFADFQGFESCLIGASTLHLYLDLVASLPRECTLVVDEGSYAISQWALHMAVGRGLAARVTPHRDLTRLQDCLAGCAGPAVVFMDDYCVSCGRPMPLLDAERIVRNHGGVLVIDGTQTLGIVGRGGVGAIGRAPIPKSNLVLIASLAKGFGAPLATLCSDRPLTRLDREGTQVHCSPAAVPVVRAAQRALYINRLRGRQLRERLRERIRLFRSGLRAAGLQPVGGMFPVQQVVHRRGEDAAAMHAELLSAGIRSLVLRGHRGRGVSVAFAISARHCRTDIGRAVLATIAACRRSRGEQGGRPRCWI